MYLSSLQKSILLKCLNNKRRENLSLESDATEKELINNSTKEYKLDFVNSSIDDLLKINNNKKSKLETIRELGIIELDSNSHAHIYFYEPLIYFFKIKPKEKYQKRNVFSYNLSDKRKNFEIIKRKFMRKDGNHKRGVIRGECKFFKKSKASLSRSFSNLINKRLIRKISIINYDNREIGIGFNITQSGIDAIK
ncbi:MAG: hypothetical protein ACJZZG_01240 [Cytophagales bacterium]|nr:MAG: hypothetical protein CNE34_00620 [Rhodothermaeota bacterium MED-G18]